jgi:RNA recognition motif-containing protein
MAGDSSTVFVGNLSDDIDEAIITSEFKKFGDVSTPNF